MTKHFDYDMDQLKKEILGLSSLVERSLHESVQSVEKRDKNLAYEVQRKDREVDLKEVEIEESCLNILAIHQPVAIDLRFIVAVLKINNDLERIGDLAGSIAQSGTHLPPAEETKYRFDFHMMSHKVKKMLHDSLTALMDLDFKLAKKVCAADDEIDEIHQNTYIMLKESFMRFPNNIDSLMTILGISRNLERIADLATNIAEDVVYMVEGSIIRHHEPEEFLPD